MWEEGSKHAEKANGENAGLPQFEAPRQEEHKADIGQRQRVHESHANLLEVLLVDVLSSAFEYPREAVGDKTAFKGRGPAYRLLAQSLFQLGFGQQPNHPCGQCLPIPNWNEQTALASLQDLR